MQRRQSNVPKRVVVVLLFKNASLTLRITFPQRAQQRYKMMSTKPSCKLTDVPTVASSLFFLFRNKRSTSGVRYHPQHPYSSLSGFQLNCVITRFIPSHKNIAKQPKDTVVSNNEDSVVSCFTGPCSFC